MIARSPVERRAAADLLVLVAVIPPGRVATVELIAQNTGVLPQVIVTLLNSLTDDERQCVPWHRVVAKGGAIGRGPHRDQQFAKLVREGVPVSPAGIVQDMARVAVTALDTSRPVKAASDATPPPAPLSRSRGMKDRPA